MSKGGAGGGAEYIVQQCALWVLCILGEEAAATTPELQNTAVAGS